MDQMLKGSGVVHAAALTATRPELLQRRAHARFAEQARDVVLDKGTALVREFNSLPVEALRELAELGAVASAARTGLDHARREDTFSQWSNDPLPGSPEARGGTRRDPRKAAMPTAFDV